VAAEDETKDGPNDGANDEAKAAQPERPSADAPGEASDPAAEPGAVDTAATPDADGLLDTGPYVDGFSRRTVLGALFVAVVMMPGAIYGGLFIGQTPGAAAQWVTIILFAELARRSFSQLKRQEVFVLFYVASAIAAVAVLQVALAGGPFAHAIWKQYLLQSPQTSGITEDIPDWSVPPKTSPAIQDRNLGHVDWWWSKSRGFLAPLSLIFFGYVLGRMTWFGLGYLLFRATSDIERLPFPLAPIFAEGSTALAESTERDEAGELRRGRSWRWRVFSVGASLGIVFGSIFILVPAVTGLFMAKPIMILPIPFADFTSNVEGILPGSLISISFDAALVLVGMVLPFSLVLGMCAGILLTSVFGNPILLQLGAFEHWKPGNRLLVNQMILDLDFWLSVRIGLALTVAVLGVVGMTRAFARRRRARRNDGPHRRGRRERRERRDGGNGLKASANRSPGSAPSAFSAVKGAPGDPPRRPGDPPYRTACKERGDIPVWVAVALFVVGAGGIAWVAHILVPDFPLWIILIFAFLWSPFHSYISARLVGLTGRGLATPYLKETVFVASGYKGIDIWFAPMPLFDHGPSAQLFRVMELTRTKFTSIIKAELLTFSVIFISSFLFWWFFWHVNQIPSDTFPFAARMWPMAARRAYIIFTANSTQNPLLLQALKLPVIAGALGVGMLLYGGLAVVGAPVVFFYGIVGGVGIPLHMGVPMLVGALLGRYYFVRKFGKERWRRYVPVVAAGFSCGVGLVLMGAVGLSFISQCTRDLPF